MPGVGTPFPEVNDLDYSMSGLAFAARGEERINWGLLRIIDALKRSLSPGNSDGNKLSDGETRAALKNMATSWATLGLTGSHNRFEEISRQLKSLESRLRPALQQLPASEAGISPSKSVLAQDPPEPAAALPIAGLAHAEPASAAAHQSLVYVVHNQQKTVPAQGAESECGAQPLPLEKPDASSPGRPWKSFIGGMLTMLLLGIAAVWGWSATHTAAVPLPVAANESSLKTLEQLPPYWLQSYGFALAASAGPRDAARLREQWQRHISGNALPLEDLSGWHQGMAGLADLTHRLNALDERKGKYLTGSELKSMVFAITHNFERVVPAEERLYQLTQIEKGALPALQASQTELHLNQLINRYMLIRGQADGHQAW